MLLRSSRNCFAAASISMRQFHQTRFVRKTFCRRLIEHCQTESMLPGLCQTFLCHLDFLSTGKKGFARRIQRWTQLKNSHSESALIGVLRASPDSVAAGRAGVFAATKNCQQEVLSRKNGASRKHHKIKQLQQIITAIRHQGKTKTMNISRFTFITFITVFGGGLS